MNNFYHIDTAFSLSIIGYIFVKWVLIVGNYGHLLYFLSLALLVAGFIAGFLLDWAFYRKNKRFGLQIVFNLLQLLLYGFLFIGLISILMGYFSIGFILFLALLISKGMRFFLVIQNYLQSRRLGRSTSISFASRKRKIVVLLLIFMFAFPSIVFSLGATSYTVARKNIDINNILGEGQGSQEIQLSFYVTLSSYDYIMNDTILSALNGTAFGGGNLIPVEVLLLVAEYELTDPVKGLKMAQMVNKSTQSGLNVWIWFVYDTSLYGHYPSYQNYEHLPEFKQVFDEWVQNYSLTIHGMLFDNEIDQEIMDTELADIFNYVQTLLQHRNTVKKNWSLAVDMYESVADNWSAQGYEIALVGMDLTLEDLKDGDADIQQMFGIVNNPPDMWDRVSYMMYRSCEYHTTPFGQDYVYNLADFHKKMYGDRAVVALGCMGYEAYDTVDEILQDIALLKYLRYTTVELFEMGNFYNTFGYNGLISLLNSTLDGWKYPEFQIGYFTNEYLARSALFFVDILLDFF